VRPGRRCIDAQAEACGYIKISAPQTCENDWGAFVIDHQLEFHHLASVMRANATVKIGSLITRTPRVCGGRPRIAGTGVSVRRIVVWYKLGFVPEEIADRIGHLSLAQVHAALAYYHANRETIEADLAAEEAEADQLEGQLAAARRRA
jgi:uncharacterized protein (DUF433 family)